MPPAFPQESDSAKERASWCSAILVPVAQQPLLSLGVESDEHNPVPEQPAEPGPVGSTLDTLLNSLLVLLRPVLITHLMTFVDWGLGALENRHNS